MKWCSYLIQANLYLVLFYAFYWLILRRETFFNLNRFYLLFVALASAVIPLLKTNWFTETAQPVQQKFINATVMVMDGYASPIENSWTLGDVLTLIYFSIIAILSIRLIYKLLSLNRILKDKNHPEAFSFFKKIRVNNNLPQQSIIREHELTHAKQFHSADVLFFELLSIINWFNPIVYCYKNSIKHIHEFIADEAVLKNETDKSPYALLLLSKTFGIQPHTLTNNFFNQSLLKLRIEMMNKTKSRKTAILKYGLSAPLFLLALVLSSATISKSKLINNLSEEVKPKKQLSELLIPATVNDYITSKKLEATDTKAAQININLANQKLRVSNPKLKSNLINQDSTKKPKSDKISNYALNEVVVTAYLPADTATATEVFTNVEVLPSFPGGMNEFGKFLARNLRYPSTARDKKIQGRVFCTFIVEKDGSLTDMKVVRGIGGGCDEEAVRVLAISPKWLPGIQDKKVVRVSYTIPIFFQLVGNDDDGVLAPTAAPPTNIPDNALLIIDGVEYKGDKNKLKDKAFLPEIKTITVLKDEFATKKYGDKGKNGVIEVTTKKK